MADRAIVEWLFVGALFIAAVNHLVIFAFRRSDRSALFFGLFSTLLMCRGLLVIHRLHSGEEGFLLRVEYVAAFLAGPVFVSFTRSLFPRRTPAWFEKVVWGVLLAESAASFVLPDELFQRSLILFWITLTGASVLLIAIYIRESITGSRDARVMLGSFAILFAAVLNDIMFANGLSPLNGLTSAGAFAFVFVQSCILGVRFVQARNEQEALSHRLKTINHAYLRFVPVEFPTLIGRSLMDLSLGDHTSGRMTILVADIRGFTALSEQMTPRETFDLVNTFFSETEPCVANNGGFIDKYTGDGFLAIFPEAADAAVQAAKDIFLKLESFNEMRKDFGYPPIAIGISIHTGPVMLGTVGSRTRFEATAIGDAVNIVFRMQDLTKRFLTRCIFSNETLTELTDASFFQIRFLGHVRMRGRSAPVPVFELLDVAPEEERKQRMETISDFDPGVFDYFSRKFESAHDHFTKVLAKTPDDAAARQYLARTAEKLKLQIPQQ